MFREKLIPVESYEIDPNPTYTLFKLHTSGGTVPLYTSVEVSKVYSKESKRPHVHDVLYGVVTGFDLKILKCIIDHMEESIYYAKIFLEKDQKEVVSVDIRPSDVLILLKQHRFPLYISQKVLDLVDSANEDF
jgi:bifunctional DNase/RNase